LWHRNGLSVFFRASRDWLLRNGRKVAAVIVFCWSHRC
jgi:hypothetical protein